jgi:phosphoglycolate phosphatase
VPLTTCLDRLGVAAEAAVMVGDSAADVGAARAAGVFVVIVPDGYTGEPAERLGADLVVKAIAEVPSRLPPRAIGAAVA